MTHSQMLKARRKKHKIRRALVKAAKHAKKLRRQSAKAAAAGAAA